MRQIPDLYVAVLVFLVLLVAFVLVTDAAKLEYLKIALGGAFGYIGALLQAHLKMKETNIQIAETGVQKIDENS